jgi:hypothetical protein
VAVVFRELLAGFGLGGAAGLLSLFGAALLYPAVLDLLCGVFPRCG